jgi:hypothetical protein
MEGGGYKVEYARSGRYVQLPHCQSHCLSCTLWGWLAFPCSAVEGGEL